MYTGVRLAYSAYSCPKSRRRCLSSKTIREAKNWADWRSGWEGKTGQVGGG